MSTSRNIFILFACVLASFSCLAQTDTTRAVRVPTNTGGNGPKGNSYGMIVGISKYQNFPSLNYADRDAMEFYQYLRSKAGGSIDSTNLRLLLNDDAKAMNIGRNLRWLETNAKNAGDVAYIYFAGHGDAANSQEAYLLTTDTHNEGDPALYSFGNAFQIYNLKNAIARMTAKGVKVVLITDACRTNELPGKEKGIQLAYGTITEQNKGEIQMTSCSQNEQSIEDGRWGNGRGVFSYYLVNGLYGMADNDNDNEVTISELSDYVRNNVKKETVSISTKRPRQTPVFRADDEYQPIAKVDPAIKEMIAKKITNKTESTTYAGRSVLHFDDSTQQKMFVQLQNAVKHKKLILPERESAVYYLDKLLAVVKDENKRTDLQDMVLAELINTAQTTINRYTHPPVEDSLTEQNAVFFQQSADYLKAANKYLEDNIDLRNQVTAKRLFLEATALAEGGNTIDELDEGVAKADSSMKLLRSSYTYNTLGQLLYKAGRYELAKQNLQTAARLAPQWPYPYITLGNVYRYLSNSDSALFYHHKALQLNLSNKNAYYSIGVDYYYDNKYDSAIRYFKKAVAISNSYTNAYNYLGISYMWLNKYDSAKLYLEKFIELDPKNEIGYYNLGLTLENLGKRDSAIYYYKQSLKVDPTYASSYINLGLLYYNREQYDSAMTLYRMALKHQPNDDYANNNIGLIFKKRNKLDSALVYFKRAFAYNHNFRNAAYNVGNTFYQLKNYDSALYYLSIAYRLKSNDIDVIEAMARSYFSKGDYENALPYYKYTNTYYPADYLRYDIGRSYYYQSNYDSAAVYFKQVKNMADYGETYYFMGMIDYEQKRYDSSIFNFKKYAVVNPDYSDGWVYIGNAHFYKKEYDSATKYYLKTIQFNPKSEYAYNNIGLANYNQSKYDSAVVYFKKGYNVNPKSYTAAFYLADSYYYIEKYDSALKYYLKAEAIKELSETAMYTVGAIYYDNGDYDNAIYYLRKALDADPTMEKAAYFLGRSYYIKEYWESALEYFQKAIAIKPTRADAYYYSGQSWYWLGKVDSAFASYRKAITIDSLHADSWMAIGYVYEHKYDSEKALYYYKKSFDLYKAGVTAFYIARTYAQIMDAQKTLDYLELAYKNGYKKFENVTSNKHFNFVKNDPRFKALKDIYNK